MLSNTHLKQCNKNVKLAVRKCFKEFIPLYTIIYLKKNKYSNNIGAIIVQQPFTKSLQQAI